MPFIDARLLLDLVPSRLLSTALLAFYRTTRNTISLFAQPAPLTLSVAAPASVSGTYPLDITSLQGGPVALRGPEIAGVPSIGAPLSLRPAIWAYDGAALPPVRSWQWQSDGIDIAGATDQAFVPTAAEAGTSLRVIETAEGAGGVVAAVSAAVAVPA